jgi:hypothetical protein
MRGSTPFVIALLVWSTPALADVKSYCETSASDFASAQTSDVDQWQLKFHSALDDCIAQYTAAPKPAPAQERKKPTVVVAVKPMAAPKLVKGSAAWNSYCAAKYTSFDKAKGTYLSLTGVVRKCVVTP